MIVGFTGGRFNWLNGQGGGVTWVLSHLEDPEEFHFGDCEFSDVFGFKIAGALGVKTVAHPPENPRQRAYCEADVILPVRSYRVRNQDIVDASDLLVATPQYPENHPKSARSGTWMTVRMARKKGIPIVVIFP